MCRANDVKIEIKDWCSAETLKNFDFSGEKPSLIMTDCEGYERELFTKESVANLKNCDCIIEVHDWCQNEEPTLDYLLHLFKDTHNCNLVYGIDDYEKAYRYQVPELSDFNIKERFEIFREGRRRLGEWLYCVHK